MDRVGVSPMLAADANLEVLSRLSSFRDRDRHQAADALFVDGLERVAREDLLLEVADDERALGVVAAESKRGLREIVGAEGEELGLLRDLAGGPRGARDLDYRADT